MSPNTQDGGNTTKPIPVVIPAYNESGRIGDVIRRATVYVPVLVVDDGSVDRTSREAGDSGATVLIQVQNQGKGVALRVGFRWVWQGNMKQPHPALATYGEFHPPGLGDAQEDESIV
jgi:Glycosyl transferase family 2